jgi:tRNA 2-thiouridine synthesizing protein A
VSSSLEYDATGLLCPLPVLRANRKMRELDVGGLLTVRATDPAAEQDFPASCRQTGHELVSATREGDGLVFVIRKKASDFKTIDSERYGQARTGRVDLNVPMKNGKVTVPRASGAPRRRPTNSPPRAG